LADLLYNKPQHFYILYPTVTKARDWQ